MVNIKDVQIRIFDDLKLNVGAWEGRSCVNGPGERFVIWFQGCPMNCPGCFNQEFRPFIRRNMISVKDLARRILQVPDIEGVTYTGGEPMVQARGLYYLSQILKRKKLTVVCYSGYYLEELKKKKNKWIGRLLELTDILIDGRYDVNQKAILIWRGSRNQRVYFLTDRYKHLQKVVNQEYAEMEIIIKDNKFITTGMLDMNLLNYLTKRIQE